MVYSWTFSRLAANRSTRSCFALSDAMPSRISEKRPEYPIPSGYEGCLTQWNEALGAIHAALEARGPLLLNNPPAVHNGAHIASVEFSFVGAAKIVERINNAHRGMGFRYEATPAAEPVS